MGERRGEKLIHGISTLMPVFFKARDSRAEALLQIAIQSVLNQSCAIPHELLIIDDGSPVPLESLRAFIPELNDPRVRIIPLPLNVKLVSALNFGLRAARYNLIARLDADDAWRPGKLEHQLRVMAAEPELTILGTSMRIHHEDDPSKDWDEIRQGSWDGIHQLIAKLGCPFPHGSILAKKEIFQFLGGYPTDPVFAHCEDLALWSIWTRFFNCAILPEIYLEYRVHAHGVSSQFENSQRRGSRIVMNRYYSLHLEPHYFDGYAYFSKKLGCGLNEIGKLFYTLWKYDPGVRVAPEDLAIVRKLLPDRPIIAVDDFSTPGHEHFANLTQPSDYLV